MNALGGPPGGREYRVTGRAVQQGGYGDATRVENSAGAATRADRVPNGMRGAGAAGAAGFGAAGRMGGGPPGRGPGGPRPGGGGPGGPGGYGGAFRDSSSDSWWRDWTLKKALKVGGAAFGGLVVVMGAFLGFMYMTTSIPAAALSATEQSNTVYYGDGKTPLGTIGSTNRTDLNLNQIPAPLQNAFLAAEDKNFYHEGGVSFTGIMRAVLHDATSGGGSANGGSTITQEFVRNYYGLGLQQTATRKIKEIIISEKLAKAESKQWVLDHYLNMVFLGNQSYGVEAAAKTYFGKSASQLTIAQDAVLAGLPQSPSAYPLPQYKANLRARWQYVINQMVKDKYITAAQAAQQKFPTLLTWADPARGQMAANVNPADNNPESYYLLSHVETEMLASGGISEAELRSGGYRINTTLDPTAEKSLTNAVNSTLSPSNLAANGSHYSKLPLWALTGAEAQDPKTGGIVAMYGGPGLNQSSSECQQDSCYQNSATVDHEQVGSSFKPYVVAAAVKQGMNVQSSVMDSSSYACIAPPSMGSTVFTQPVTQAMYRRATAALGTQATKPSSGTAQTGCPSGYFPEENDSGESIGKPVYTAPSGPYAGATYASDNVQDALAQSSNVTFTDLIHKTGTRAPETIAEQVGSDPKAFAGSLGDELGVALGEAPMTVENQASLIAMLADNGTYHTAHIVKSWTNPSAGTSGTPKVKTTQVLTPPQASQVQYTMEKTTVNGTAKNLVSMSQQGRQVLGKTGTTTSNHSGFFIGAIPQFAMAVGMFTAKGDNSDSTQNLGALDSSNAANIYPTMIWNSFANSAYASTPPEAFPPLNTAGTTAWNMFPALPKPPKPKPKPTPTPSASATTPAKGNPHQGGGLFGNQQPTTPAATPTQPSNCGGLFGGSCSSSSAAATPSAGPGNGGGNKPGG